MSNVWSTAHRWKRSEDFMFMLGLSKTMDQLTMENGLHWYGHVLGKEDGHVFKREDDHVLRKALDFEVEVQGKKGRPKRTWKKQVEEESVKVGLRREDTLCRSKWSVGINQIGARLR